jgi:hypothetical protein
MTISQRGFLLSMMSIIVLLGIAFFAPSSSSAQIALSRQNDIQLEVYNSPDAPVFITQSAINESPYFQDVRCIDFALQNIGQKRIIVFVPLLSSASFVDGNMLNHRYDFDPGKLIQTGMNEDRIKFKPGDVVSLSIDYVLFSDGTSWGKDTQKNSESIAGYFDGEKFAIEQIRGLLKEKNSDELFRLLRLAKAGKLDDSPPPVDTQKSEKWQRGFLSAYKTTLVFLLPYDYSQNKHLFPEDSPELQGYAARLRNIEYSRSRYLDKEADRK